MNPDYVRPSSFEKPVTESVTMLLSIGHYVGLNKSGQKVYTLPYPSCDGCYFTPRS